jgi:predicted Zn-dependent protease
MFYAAIAIYAKHDAVAQDLLKALPRKNVITNDLIVQAYLQTGQTQKVLEIVKERVALTPQDPQAHVSLAYAYLLAKDNKNAIASLRKAVELNPSLKAEVDQYIQMINEGKLP